MIYRSRRRIQLHVKPTQSFKNGAANEYVQNECSRCLEFVKAGAPGASHFQALGALLQGAADRGALMTTFVFSLDALLLYYVLYQSKLIPRWLSIWGLIAIALHLATGFLILFGLQSGFDISNSIMNLPIFLQEMVMAVWLIVKGLNPTAIASTSARADMKLIKQEG